MRRVFVEELHPSKAETKPYRLAPNKRDTFLLRRHTVPLNLQTIVQRLKRFTGILQM